MHASPRFDEAASKHVQPPPPPDLQPLLPAACAPAVAALGRDPLPVLVQVNTSGEESKYGVEPKDCVALARHIHESCKHLRLAGLMTIGMPGELLK